MWIFVLGLISNSVFCHGIIGEVGSSSPKEKLGLMAATYENLAQEKRKWKFILFLGAKICSSDTMLNKM